jgi:glutaredoxin
MPNYFYTEPGCAACVEAKNFLISRGIPFEERDIRANPDYLRILTDDLDSRTTPTFVVADKIIVGFDLAEYELLAGTSRTKPKKQASSARNRSHSRIA